MSTDAARRPLRASLFFWAAIAAIAAIVFVAVSGARAAAARSVGSEPPAPVPVSFAAARSEALRPAVHREGLARAVERRVLFFEVEGRVVEIGKDERGLALREGALVRGPRAEAPGGDLIARVESAAIREAVAEAESAAAAAAGQLAMAEAQVLVAAEARSSAADASARTEKLYASDLASEKDRIDASSALRSASAAVVLQEAQRDAARANLEIARAGLRRARDAESKASLRAPLDGRVGLLNVRLGDWVSPAGIDAGSSEGLARSAAAVVVADGDIEVEIEVAEREAAGIAAGDPAEIRRLGVGETPRPGRVRSVSPVVYPGSRTRRILVTTPGGAGAPADGETVQATLWTGPSAERIVLPMDALVFDGPEAFAFVFDASRGTVSKVPVSIGIRSGGLAEIFSGARPGDLVVRDGRAGLRDGAAVVAAEGALP